MSVFAGKKFQVKIFTHSRENPMTLLAVIAAILHQIAAAIAVLQFNVINCTDATTCTYFVCHISGTAHHGYLSSLLVTTSVTFYHTSSSFISPPRLSIMMSSCFNNNTNARDEVAAASVVSLPAFLPSPLSPATQI